jgi:hypothetical protein
VKAATISAGRMFQVTQVTTLFATNSFVIDNFHQSFVVLPGEDAFAFLTARQLTTAGGPQIVWVDNWFRDLDARLEQ